jgi:IMP dehydrogenase
VEFYGARPDVDLTYSDVFLVPRRSAVTSRLDVDLSPGDGTTATIPLVAANMNSVTGPRLAATLARRGGLGILPQDLPLQELDAAIRGVKEQPVRWDTPLVLPPSATVADAAALLPATEGHGIVVAERASERLPIDAVLGVIPATRLGTALPDARLGDLARGHAASIDADDVESARHAFDLIVAAEAETVCVLHHGFVVGTLSRRSALRANLYRPAVDASGRLIVGAAVGINGDVQGKAKALAAAGVDVLVVDTAHGHQEGMLRALSAVADLDLGIPIVAGNVVTAEGVRDLVAAGADILKVGVGPGAMCTTRMMTAVGRPRVGGRRRALPARRRPRARGGRGIRHDRLVVRRHDRGARRAARRRRRPGVQGIVGDGVVQGRARAVRPSRPVRAGAQGAVRRGDLVVEDLPRPAPPGHRGPRRHDHVRRALVLHLRGRRDRRRVPRRGASGSAVRRRLRRGQGAPRQLVTPPCVFRFVTQICICPQ